MIVISSISTNFSQRAFAFFLSISFIFLSSSFNLLLSLLVRGLGLDFPTILILLSVAL
jgi:hypothetical protein